MRLLAVLFSLFLVSNAALASETKAPKFSDLEAANLKGEKVSFKTYEGKVVLVVNTASKCGYTPQYGGLQKLYDKYKDRGLVVIGFPSDDFHQEDLDGQGISKFCELNYGVKFPMFKKTHVNGNERHPVYKYLVANSSKGGDVQWNFEKFLVNRRGEVIGRYTSGVTPTDGELTKAIESALADAKT